MKNLICILFFLIAIPSVFAQTQKPVAKGVITITTGQKMPFINLRFQDDIVVFTNTATNSEYTYFLKTVKVIQDADKNVIYQQSNNTVVPVVENNKQALAGDALSTAKKPGKLIFKNCDRALLDGKKLKPAETREILKVHPEVLRNYNTGRTLNTIGDLALGTGLGMIIGTGISNLNKADDEVDYDGNSDNSVSPLIIVGAAIAVIAIPLKIAGRSKVKDAIGDYNWQSGIADKSVKPEVFAVAKTNGLALIIKW